MKDILKQCKNLILSRQAQNQAEQIDGLSGAEHYVLNKIDTYLKENDWTIKDCILDECDGGVEWHQNGTR